MADRFYVTTPIYYVNDVPHLGHAYTTVVADALARYHRARGRRVHFLTGTDEHGEKIEEAARKRRIEPKKLADQVVERFQATWRALDVQHDDFIRTTEPRHEQVVADMWRRIEAAGDLYLGEYQGLYCVACEGYYGEDDLTGGNCPVHQRPPERRKEPSWFFRLSRYQQPLLDHFDRRPEFVRPETRRNEVVSFIRSGLRDLSVSRTGLSWGVPVPGAPDHVVYVWIDALTNYVSALGGPGADLYRAMWPADVHLIGKDILRFHAVYWPALLLSAGLELPRCVLAHGWWSVTGRKISKSLPATRVDPVAIAADIGPDALRYYLCREVPLGEDGDFSCQGLIDRLNADLANDLGNLVHRTLHMVQTFADGAVPDPEPGDEPLAALGLRARDAAADAYQALAPQQALAATWELVRAANRYLVENEPWKLRNDPGKAARLRTVLYHPLEAIRFAAELCAPVMPRAATEIRRQIGLAAQAAVSRWPARWGELAPGLPVARGEPVWPRIDADRAAALVEKWTAPAAPPADSAAAGKAAADKAAAPADDGRVSYQEFSRLDLRVAEVKSAEPVAGADRLLRVTVDLGGETREVVAGIARAYAPSDLVGRRVVFLANLRPAKIRGVRSDGMILAAGDGDVLALTAFDRELPPGTRVK